MFEKLNLTAQKFDEINQKLSDPSVINNTSLYTQLMKEYKSLTPVVEKYNEYLRAKSDFEEAKELLDAGGLDKEMKEMAQLEYEEQKEKMELFTEELKLR